ncbi:MAG: DUF3093 domain-containing protein [Propionicimonas sp.]|nr:DUF3093 domain-containing protein [Propionicimonas sp.]
MRYRERLTVPVSWWGIGLFFAVSFATAVGFWVGPVVSLVAGAASALLVAAALTWFGRTLVVVDDRGLAAGEALLEWEWLGEVVVHDAAATRDRLGRDADHRAYLVVRGYIRTSVEVEVADPEDPHPHWVVSTRHPRELAAAIAARRSMMPR